MPKKVTTKDFVDRSKSIHGNKYDYSKTKYVKAKEKVTITCPDHGDFKVSPNKHLAGSGCKFCARNRVGSALRSDKESFVKKAEKVYNGKYDYSKSVYKTNSDKIEILCPEHGPFWANPSSHLSGYSGCKGCSKDKERQKNSESKTERFIGKAKSIHGDRYDYSSTVFFSSMEKVSIMCRKHGEFLKTPSKHLWGQGCPQCSIEEQSEGLKTPFDEHIKKMNAVHDHYYEYTKSEKWIPNYEKIEVICPKHGPFYSSIANHKQGKGCPSCANINTKPEREIFEFIRSLYNGKIERNNRKVVAPKEIDILLPDLKLGIEYCGVYWHSTEYVERYYHKKKLEAMQEAGYRLITIFEDEWQQKREIVKNRIASHIKKQKRFYARKCDIFVIPKEVEKQFIEKNHIQGYVPSKFAIGIFYQGEILSVMSFGKARFSKKFEWELIRFCSKPDTVVIGGAGKLYNFFKRQKNPSSVVSYCDLRWGNGEVYEKIGMSLVSVSDPNYFYFKRGTCVLESRNKYQKHKLKKILPDFSPDKSEWENMRNNKYFRIFDCGNKVFAEILC